jgi:hypothetical protein
LYCKVTDLSIALSPSGIFQVRRKCRLLHSKLARRRIAISTFPTRLRRGRTKLCRGIVEGFPAGHMKRRGRDAYTRTHCSTADADSL